MEMQGTEKQIKRAGDIKKQFVEIVQNATKEQIIEADEDGEPEDIDFDGFKRMCEIVVAQNHAPWWINHAKDLDLETAAMHAEEWDEKEFRTDLRLVETAIDGRNVVRI